MQTRRTLHGTAWWQDGADQDIICGPKEIFCYKQGTPVWKDNDIECLAEIIIKRLWCIFTWLSVIGDRRFCGWISIFLCVYQFRNVIIERMVFKLHSKMCPVSMSKIGNLWNYSLRSWEILSWFLNLENMNNVDMWRG